MNGIEKKRLMTDVAKGIITMKEAENKIAPINSKKGKSQRDALRDRLKKEADEEDTQERKTKSLGGKK